MVRGLRAWDWELGTPESKSQIIYLWLCDFGKLFNLLVLVSWLAEEETTTVSYLLTAKSLQSCPTLCDPIDGSPPGSPVPGILQARTLEWVAISFSNAWKGKVKVKSLSRARLLATPWTAAHQAPPSMGFSRQEYWSLVRWLWGLKEAEHIKYLLQYLVKSQTVHFH